MPLTNSLVMKVPTILGWAFTPQERLRNTQLTSVTASDTRGIDWSTGLSTSAKIFSKLFLERTLELGIPARRPWYPTIDIPMRNRWEI
ncbi:hypothetical protein C8J55DRAFT_510796 [Lentinula edodes]|uniref:Uncharacterized protein n=1 Tax=Lentinula lateritia TaxID=40482 RepID=A0A9W9AH67_9AGAR|nr:hypothetical protein C8J55DRAFT_510796 [Lentinula edodes]